MSTSKTLSRKRVVLLDDSMEFRADFLESWKRLTPQQQATYKFDAPDCYDPVTVRDLTSRPPDYLVIDWTVGGQDGAIDWLKDLSKSKAIDGIKLVLIVGGGPFEAVHRSGVFECFHKVSRVYLPKGFRVSTLLRVLTDEGSTTGDAREYIPLDDESTPDVQADLLMAGALASVPVRRLDSQLKPIRTNLSWKLDVDEPVRFSEQERQRLQQGDPVTQVLRGLTPGNPDEFDWYFLATWQVGESYLQLALGLPEHWQNKGAESTIEDVLAMMREAGFTRGRYYAINRVTGVDGRVLELVAANYSTKKERPIARPLDGVLAVRVDEYERRSLKKRTLTYMIRTREDDQPADDAIKFWNDVVGADPAISWLEVPIYCRSTDRVNSDSQLMGWLIFDRVGALTSPDQVFEFHVAAVKARLLSALDYMAKNRRTDQERTQRSQYHQLQTYIDALSRTINKGEIEQATVTTLKEITEADSVVLAVNDTDAKLLRVSIESEQLLTGLVFPYRLDRFLMVKCAINAKPVYRPDYAVTPNAERISEDYWLQVHGCDAARAKKCQQWLDDTIRSVAAFPIMLDDKTLLGAVVLRKARPFFFTAERLELAEHALRLALPYFRHLHETDNRNVWDATVMHEVRAGLTQVFNKIDIANRNRPPAVHNYLILALKDLYDLTNTFLELLGEGDAQRVPATLVEQEKGLRAIVREYCSYRAWGEDGRSFDLTPCDRDPTAADVDNVVPRNGTWFHRVARILIDNAFRYGTEGAVHCALRIDNGSLILEVRNYGTFSDAVIQNEFRGFHQRPDLAGRSMRAHLGFAMVQRLCTIVGALPPKFYNDEHNTMAVARVAWPLLEER